jgi:hypothetical protein
MKQKNNEAILDWLAIAKNDIKSANILYKEGQYRTSYFLFQQASEKVAKGYAIFIGFPEDKIMSMNHDQFKAVRKKLAQQHQSLVELMPIIEKEPSLDFMREEGLGLEKAETNAKQGLSFLDSLKGEDLSLLDEDDLKLLLSELEELKNFEYVTRDNMPEIIYKSMDVLFEKFTTIPNVDIEQLKKMRSDFKSEEYIKLMEALFLFIIHLSYVGIASFYCSFVTIQHSSKTRYNMNDHRCLELYTIDLPIVKYQQNLIDHLQEAIERFENEVLKGLN